MELNLNFKCPDGHLVPSRPRWNTNVTSPVELNGKIPLGHLALSCSAPSLTLSLDERVKGGGRGCPDGIYGLLLWVEDYLTGEPSYNQNCALDSQSEVFVELLPQT